ncbi:MAG: Cof-type HAD-IIB family hydrolase [Micrococcales bacterium]|nr:Cof-type HAD-IIB family hydrolase [Micrococcales bacterium]
MTPTLVALDVDGTIVHFDGAVAPVVRQALDQVRAAGVHIVLATGRSVAAVMPVVEDLGLVDGYVVCSNGAVTCQIDPASTDGYRLLDVVTFDPGPAVRALTVEIPDALIAVEDLTRGSRVSAPFPPDELAGEHVVVGFDDLVSRPATRVVIRDPGSTPEVFHDIVQRVGLHEVSYAVGWSAWLDLTPAGVSKASALENIRQRLGVEPYATVAVGDGGNDVEMLRWAARGVAMGHAAANVREAADEVTATIDDDGLVPVLRSLL